jgi:hypothetical protein
MAEDDLDPARPSFQELRTALRELNPLSLDDPGDSYDASATNAIRVLQDGGTAEEAADLVIETLRVEHGVLLQGFVRRLITSRIQDPRLDREGSDRLTRWMVSWRADLILTLFAIYLSWEATREGHPWTLLAFPGLMGFAPAWSLLLRLFGFGPGQPVGDRSTPRSRWLIGGLPQLVFAVTSSAVLFMIAPEDEIYRRAAYFSLIWVALAVLGSLFVLLRHPDGADSNAPDERDPRPTSL